MPQIMCFLIRILRVIKNYLAQYELVLKFETAEKTFSFRFFIIEANPINIILTL